MPGERRQFERLQVPSDATALDDGGRRLGLVTEAGGGGMAISLDRDVPPTSFTPGMRLRVTVVESNNVRNTVPVEVRYIVANVLGLAFAESETPAG